MATQKVVSRLLFAVALAFQTLLPVDVCRAADMEGTAIPGCGETAAFSLLRLQGTDVVLSKVSESFRQRNPRFEFRRVSIRELRDVVEGFGVRTTAVRWPANRLEQLPTPSILYFRPKRWAVNPSSDTGHFITVSGIEEGQVSAFDWAPISTNPELRLPLEVVRSAWDGDAIILEGKGNAADWIWPCLIAGVVVVLLSVIWRRSARDATVALLVVGTCLNCGCSRTAPSPVVTEPLLVFADAAKSLGLVSGDRPIEVRFAFQVRKQGPVTIREVSKSCGCTTINSELVGRSLEAGSSHELVLQLNPNGTAARAEVSTVTLKTEPASAAPIILALSYRCRSAPRVSVSEVFIESNLQQPSKTEFEITYHRAPGDLKAELKLAESDFGEFQTEKVVSKTEDFHVHDDVNQKLLIDMTTVQLRSNRTYDYGVHRSQMTLAFEGHPKQTLPVVVRVLHPFRPQFSRVFCGPLKVGQTWTKDIPIQRGAEDLKVQSIDCEPAWIHSKLSGRKLAVSVLAPEKTGRFEGRITVRFEGDNPPAVTIPISGTVIEN